MRYLPPTRAETPPEHATLVYDGDCGFCFTAVQAIQRHARERIELVAFSDARARGLLADLDDRQLYASAHFIGRDGIEVHGGASMTRALRLVPGGGLTAVLDLPGVSLLRDAGYRIVELNRHRISRLMGKEACVVRAPDGVDGYETGPRL